MSDRWELREGIDEAASDIVTDRLVGHNMESAPIVRDRFEPENLRSRPVAVYAYLGGRLVGGAEGSTVDVWQWLTVDLLWVDEDLRGQGLGRVLVSHLEDQARRRGCRWSKLNTWDFQAPEFYRGCGYVEYGREVDFPPGHTNFLMRKDLS